MVDSIRIVVLLRHTLLSIVYHPYKLLISQAEKMCSVEAHGQLKINLVVFIVLFTQVPYEYRIVCRIFWSFDKRGSLVQRPLYALTIASVHSKIAPSLPSSPSSHSTRVFILISHRFLHHK